MLQPIKFPNQFDVIHEEAERFNKLSPDQKFRMIEDLIQTGLEFIEISPYKDQALKLKDERERQWLAAQSKLVNFVKN
jgi:hypothetical protein